MKTTYNPVDGTFELWVAPADMPGGPNHPLYAFRQLSPEERLLIEKRLRRKLQWRVHMPHGQSPYVTFQISAIN